MKIKKKDNKIIVSFRVSKKNYFKLKRNKINIPELIRDSINETADSL